ncbi:MAG: WXG100 family type VII secretion target [Lachnospiraceae bacterium]|nr:WXG100 family type VII secretion target [Lachnospiraceae bacterium]
MATKNTVNLQKMRSAVTELENIHSTMTKNLKVLDETMAKVKQVWNGEAATTYLKQYEKHLKSFQNMANAINSASNSLAESCNIYDQVDSQTMDIVQKMGKRN